MTKECVQMQKNNSKVMNEKEKRRTLQDHKKPLRKADSAFSFIDNDNDIMLSEMPVHESRRPVKSGTQAKIFETTPLTFDLPPRIDK